MPLSALGPFGPELVIVLLNVLILAAVVGGIAYLVGRLRRGPRRRIAELEARVAELEEELDR